jgi:hypothetical protein
MNNTTRTSALALALCAAAGFAQAAPATSSIDPNTFIVGHPASPTWKNGHSNGEHPAVLVSGRAAAQAPDSNTFLVQPPTSVRWTTLPKALVVAAVPR